MRVWCELKNECPFSSSLVSEASCSGWFVVFIDFWRLD